ncbi:ppGpp synthetase/RelA/SpoT-type nucleotidyltransferase [Gallaecimonas pentaromativorans]|uniref:PpGpp synthetase/RelA/SpoT-type nucleotidyltransferase n=1 Tax=Gallaecimonas pentaromativorans TaxID=584787 RepID=A0A3N1P2M4_9GAMM|nr:ppGpp synthetase/RelA/SpoT-type nucleotidyltransferase [Gallaecimonas pentaromativorans]
MSIVDLSLEFFLENNRITREDWEKAAIEFDELKAIALDHAAKVTSLDDTASYLAKILQKCPQVHSVRWRVKDPVHLIEKIVRKRVLGSEKYLTINTKNYTEIITDLIGVRVLHLFKYEWVNIQEHILAHWKNEEAPVAYIRSGDEGEIVESYKANSCEVKNHPAGYRSIHYVISTQPTLNKVFSEIQVRTIFEEGWSEIDHKIRYPNFSNNELISYFLTIFNCMAGSADEMGSFVRNLTSEINIQELKIDEINRAQELHLSKIEELASELSNEKNKSKNKDSKVNKLSSEIQKLRANSQTRIYNESNLSATERLIAKATAIRAYSQNINSAAEKIASMNANILGGNSAAKIAAMNANILGGNSAAKLAAMNANILAGNSAAKIAEKVISKPSADEETGSDTEN